MKTHKFKLLSGVECEITKFTGKHQRYFTQQEYQKDSKGANMAMADIIVKLGDLKKVTPEQVDKMLSEDRKQLLMQARTFSLKRHKEFKFEYKFDQNGKQHTENMTLDVNVEDFEAKPYKQQFTNYGEIWDLMKEGKWGMLKLEDEGKEIFFSPINGTAETAMSGTSMKTRSSHSLIKVHNPQYFHVAEKNVDKDGKGAMISLDLDSLSMDDIEDLRMAIREEMGKQPSKAVFENPETGLDEEIDVLTIPAFFFPSNAL